VIARIWRGAVRAEDGDAYVAYIEATGLREYRATPGNRGAWLLRRHSSNNGSCPILTSIVDHQDLKIRHHPRKSLEDSRNRCGNHRLFIIGWQHDGNADREV